MLLEQIIGQNRVKNSLRQMASSGRIPHSMIFLGNEGSGNLGLALAFAQMLQCTQKTPEGEACDSCNACHKSSKRIHPDVHFSYPTVGAKEVSETFIKQWREALLDTPYQDANTWLQRLGAENKQGNITKLECVSIIKKLSFKIFEGNYKILIMWLPEFLGKEGNRLLKLIEEPPPNTIFIFVAENEEKILNTILSRCQTLKFDTLEDQTMVESLEKSFGLTTDKAQQIAFLSEGNYAEARKIAANPDADNGSLFLDWFRKCWQGKPGDLVRWVDQFSKMGRENQKQFLLYGLHFIRELLLYLATGNSKLRLSTNESATALKMAKVLDFDKIEQINDLLNKNHYYIERNGNPKPIFLSASIKLHQIMSAR